MIAQPDSLFSKVVAVCSSHVVLGFVAVVAADVAVESCAGFDRENLLLQVLTDGAFVDFDLG